MQKGTRALCTERICRLSRRVKFYIQTGIKFCSKFQNLSEKFSNKTGILHKKKLSKNREVRLSVTFCGWRDKIYIASSTASLSETGGDPPVNLLRTFGENERDKKFGCFDNFLRFREARD